MEFEPHAVINPDRDPAILAWLGTHGVVTSQQVANRWFGGNYWLGNRRIRKLRALGLVRSDWAWRGMPKVHRLTRDGMGVARIDVWPAGLVYSELRHTLALVDLLERLQADNPGSTLTTERQIRAEWRRRKATKQFTGRLPDGVIQLATGERYAIELDLTPKRTAHIQNIIYTYSGGGYAGVWWFVEPGKGKLVRAAVVLQRADDFIEVKEWQPPPFVA
jgi:hypothetical protein